jgi:hypothetical protein
VPENADPGAATDLLFRLLSLDPARRPTAAEALEDVYFTSHPPGMEPAAAAAELRRRCRRLRSRHEGTGTGTGTGEEERANGGDISCVEGAGAAGGRVGGFGEGGGAGGVAEGGGFASGGRFGRKAVHSCRPSTGELRAALVRLRLEGELEAHDPCVYLPRVARPGEWRCL